MGEPLPTSHGQDVYADVFGVHVGAAPPEGDFATPPPEGDCAAPGAAPPGL
jgi:hypothetical protein